MKHLSGVDALFLGLETDRQAMNLTGVGIYDRATHPSGGVGYDDVLERARETCRRHRALRRKPVPAALGLDQPVWVEDADFSVESHVFRVSLPEPGTREQLDQEIARIHARVIDRRRPLWEWWFIDGLNAVEGTAPGSFAIAYKHHHAAFDGASALAAIRFAHDNASATEAREPRFAEIPPPKPGWLELAADGVGRALGQPARLADTLRGSAQLLAQVARREVEPFPRSAGKAPQTPFNGVLSDERGHTRIQLSLEAMETIRSAQEGVTLDDVVLSIIGGGMRSYLDHHGVLPGTSLIVGALIALRPERRREGAANNVTLAVMPLGTDIADPLERLRFVSHWANERKRYLDTVPVHKLNDCLDYVIGPAITLARGIYRPLKMANLIRLPYNFVVTDVDVSEAPLYFSGARMVDFETCAPIYDGTTIVHCAAIYQGVVNISVDFDALALPDPAIYSQFMVRSHIELLEACGRVL